MDGKFIRGLISRMWLLPSMMEAWMLNLNSLLLEMRFSQVKELYWEWVYHKICVITVQSVQVHSENHLLTMPLESTFCSIVGYVFTRGGYVEMSTKLSLPLGRTLDRYAVVAFWNRESCRKEASNDKFSIVKSSP